MKKIGLFAAGVLFGTAGMKLLGSKDAKRAYAQTTAAALRAKDSVMTAVTAVREGADDIYAEAKAINAQRTDHALPLRIIHHHGIPRPVIDLDGAHAVHRQQIVFQHVRLPQRHSLTAKMDPQPPGRIM